MRFEIPRYSVSRAQPIAERLLRHIELDGEHWIWTGSVLRSGYGSFTRRPHGTTVHRVAYEEWVGPIPAGHDVHHICETRLCINPAHLQATDRAAHRRAHRAEQVKRGTDRWGVR